jgi:putative flavoprotein involved in K+ transport
MPPQPGATYPDARHVVDYLTDYEQRYDLPAQRGIQASCSRRR